MKIALLIVTLKYTILLPRMFDVFNTIFSNKILEREREREKERTNKETFKPCKSIAVETLTFFLSLDKSSGM